MGINLSHKDAIEWEEHLPLMQPQRLMEVDELALQIQPLDLSFLQIIIAEGRTWFHANYSKRPSDPSTSHKHKFPITVDKKNKNGLKSDNILQM